MSSGQVVAFAVLVLTGFTACAEFGSYAFVHPVIKRLDVPAHVQVERGLVRTFGRVMPVLMTLTLLVVVLWASRDDAAPGALRVVASALWALGLLTTILVNVRINLRTAGWTAEESPERWRAMRQRWEVFQAFRSWAFLLSFLTVALALAGELPG